MKAHQYFRALNAMRRAVRGRGDRHQDVILVLEFASDMQFALARAENS